MTALEARKVTDEKKSITNSTIYKLIQEAVKINWLKETENETDSI